MTINRRTFLGAAAAASSAAAIPAFSAQAFTAGVSQAPFGTLPNGRQVTQYTLANARGMVVRILDFGGIITEINVPDRNGVFADVAL
jgi:aldose 1-epimerase